MGQVQTTGSVSTVGPGATLTLTTPICAQISLQFTATGSISVGVDVSLDGVNFTGSSVGGAGGAGTTLKTSSGQSFGPIAAIRYNVSSITGTASISIAAAPSGTQ